MTQDAYAVYFNGGGMLEVIQTLLNLVYLFTGTYDLGANELLEIIQ